MSSDKFIKMRIKQMILNEKVAQFGAGRGRSGADIGYDMNVRDGWRGHGQDPFFTRSSTYADAIGDVVGHFAPTVIMATKTVTDLGVTAVSFARTLVSGVGALFTGQGVQSGWNQIAADQTQAFRNSDARARSRIARWGNRTNQNVPFLQEMYDQSNAAQLDQTQDEAEIIGGVDSDLSRFLESVRSALAATTADELASVGSIAIGLDQAIFSSSSIDADVDVTPETRQEVERRTLPHMKSVFLSSAKNALEQTRQSVFQMYRQLSVTIDPVVEEQIRQKYRDAISQIDSMRPDLA